MSQSPSQSDATVDEQTALLRITIVLGPFLPTPPAAAGAIERRWADLAERFAQLGHTVALLSCRDPQLADNETVRGVRHLRCTEFRRTNRLARDLPKDLCYSLAMWRTLPPSDIVVTNAFWLPAFLTLRRCLPSGTRRRVVVNVARMPKGQMWLYARVDRLACVSHAIAETVRRQRPRAAQRIRVIPNPIETDVFRPPAPSQRFTRDQRAVLYTGRVHPEKGLELLIDAFAQVHATRPDTVLRLMGPSDSHLGGGGNAYLAQLRQRAANLPVEFHKPIYDRAQLAARMHEAEVFCYPSLAERGESFGIAPLEAMATGMATVVSKLSCFDEFLEHERTGIVFDHRGREAPARLAEALARLLDDPAAARRLGEGAAARARNFSYQNVAERYLADFHELMHGTPANTNG